MTTSPITANIYPNNLKNWEFDKPAQKQHNLNKLCDACGLEDSGCPTPSKTNSSGCLGINQNSFVKEIEGKIIDLLSESGFIYVPVINAYLAGKDNVFFNTADQSANFLESSGNFLLTPVRYLFSGKDVKSIDANQVLEMSQTFDYCKDSAGLEIFKTILAVLSLPVSLILGTALKGASYLAFPTSREMHKKIENEVFSTKIEKNDDYYRQIGIPQLFSNELLAHENYPARAPTEKQRAQTQAVKDVADLLEQKQIPHWLDCGTLLGARRHGQIIPWDLDVDMGILANDFTNVLHALRGLDPQKYAIQDWSCCRVPKMFLRVLIKETNSYLDLYAHELDVQNRTAAYKYSWTDSPWVPESITRREIIQCVPINTSDIFPLKKARFGNAVVHVPGNWEEFLKVKYGPNLSPSKVWNPTTGQYDKISDHPYWQQSNF